MWVSAILPIQINNQISNVCLSNNLDIKLSERFFKFPLHISLKRTFYTDDYLSVKEDLKSLLHNQTITISNLKPIINSNMIWLEFENNNKIIEIHKEIDKLLLDKYNIPIDEFDRIYHPHVTIFRDDDIQKLNNMYSRIKDLIIKEDVLIDTYAMGTNLDNNEFYKV